jgi:L-ascorbate metabolism protein UlaG (beta-lactamase superfamily)
LICYAKNMWFILISLIPIAGIFAFYRLYPPLGGKSAKNAWAKSKNFRENIFVNQIPTPMDMSRRDMLPLLREMMRRGMLRKPTKVISPEKIDVPAILASKKPQVSWLGHSTSLIRINNKTIMTDPILSKRASPFPFSGPKRIISKLPISAKNLPPIDAVLISHDHYDHLDFSTIKKIRHKTTKFFVPLGVAAHLRRWGVRQEQIVELDWWEEATFDGLKFVCTPSRHFSGRSLNDRSKTLWCSWVVHAKDTRLFFSGDTGYGPHFKQIGKKYGPFDLTLMECGQYNELWGNIHMMPEQTLAAHQDLRGKRLLPIHWGVFVLSLHAWMDPIIRVKKAAESAHVDVVTPRLGEVVLIKSADYPKSAWWENY